jgi:cytochrome b involved in lipid metabolism
MEVHLAFSRDSRGLTYDPTRGDLVERRTEPRYIDTLIVEQGATVCDLVMSKKQGGLGGYLFICGSVAVFDSVMSGIRKAIYNHRTATMESTDLILNNAFAERRIMLDVFMTPKPLPCNLPTIPISQLALHTGHRGGRIWLGVHGSVYDVTDFCPMHPGGTLIIKSNAGVDCTKSFDNLAHTNNPEVASLLTKYFVGHLTPKPEYHGFEELSSLYDMWADYLRTTVETLVAQQFEMDDILGSSKLWFQGNMINMLGVRIFYQYQSRLLQSGFSALFGPKFQELVLKLSFAMANSAPPGSNTKLPDILGIIARAKTSADAVATSKEVSLIGHFICDSESARFQERGIIDYANKSVQLDIELLEDIREEACAGMDGFDSLMDLKTSSDQQRMTATCSFLMQILERMAKRLEFFYSKLAQFSIYQPEMERNPARTRWNLVRRRIRDGSFFILAQNTTVGDAPAYKPTQTTVEFDRVLSQVQHTISKAPRWPNSSEPMQLNDVHRARLQAPANGASAFESHENSTALNRMSKFIDKNMRAMRRLSKVPPVPLGFDQLSLRAPIATRGIATPPPSRGSSRSPSRDFLSSNVSLTHSHDPSMDFMNPRAGIQRRYTNTSDTGQVLGRPSSMTHLPPSPAPTPPLNPAMAFQSMIGKLNVRSRVGTLPISPPVNVSAMNNMNGGMYTVGTASLKSVTRSRASTATTPTTAGGSLRALKLRDLLAEQERARITPTF